MVTPSNWRSQPQHQLDVELLRVDRLAKAGELPEASIVEGVLKIIPPDDQEREELEQLTRQACKFGNYLRIRGGSRKLNANGRTLFANGVRRSVMLFEWLSPSMD